MDYGAEWMTVIAQAVIVAYIAVVMLSDVMFCLLYVQIN